MKHKTIIFHGEEICVKCRMTRVYFTSECPDSRLSNEVAELVKEGKIDYKDSQGWHLV